MISFVTLSAATELNFFSGVAKITAGEEGEYAMGRDDRLTPEERARIAEIQDLLIDRYVEQEEVRDKGDNARAKEIRLEIKELQREKEKIKEWATT